MTPIAGNSNDVIHFENDDDGFRVLMGVLAMLVSRHSVNLCLVMLAHVVMMRCLKVVMGGGVMVCRSSVVTRRN